MENENGRWVTMNGKHIFIRTNEHPMNAFIKQKKKNKKEYQLDIKNSHIDYAPATQKKNFKKALEFAVDNNVEDVRVNRIEYHFDFDNEEVYMGRPNDLIKYKMK